MVGVLTTSDVIELVDEEDTPVPATVVVPPLVTVSWIVVTPSVSVVLEISPVEIPVPVARTDESVVLLL